MSSTTVTPMVQEPPTHARRAAAGCSLVAGAAALALARALTNNGGTPAERLDQVSGHGAQVTASTLLAVVGFAALIPGFLAVAARIRSRGAALATVGAGLTVAGCVGFAVLAALDGVPTLAATRVRADGVMTRYLHQLDNAPALTVLGPIAVVGFFAGPFLVTLAARRAGLVGRWLPWAVLAGAVLQPVGLAVAGPGTAKRLLDVACQLVLLAAIAALCRSTLMRR